MSAETQLKRLSLRDVNGIGPEYESRLLAAGITSVEELVEEPPERIAEILGATVARAKRILVAAREVLADWEIVVKTAGDIMVERSEHVKKIPTGSRDLDRILGGGVETDNVTALVGEFGSGKTQLCKQLAVNCVAQLGRSVAWIETEPGTFRPERIKQICELGGLDVDKVMDSIYVIPANVIVNTTRQYAAYITVMNKIEKGGLDIGLMVIDSFSARFRSEFVGRERFADRGAELARHFGMLEFLASKYNIAITLTGQVMGVPDISSQMDAKIKTMGHDKRPYGGEYFLHSAGTIIYLDQISSNIFEATVIDSSWLPRDRALFAITEKGITDAPEKRQISRLKT